VKKFVLLRGKKSEILYLYEREVYEHMLWNKNLGDTLEFVTDNDDSEVLRQMQALVNPEIEVNK
jgi:hypothetical protein